MKKYRWLVRGSATVLAVVLILALAPPSVHSERDTRLLREIEYYIQQYYLYELPDEVFPLNSLDNLSRVFVDQHSEYLAPGQLRALEEGLGRILYGIGIYLEMDDESRATVTATVSGSPAERSGIQAGDRIIAVNGDFLVGKSLEEVTSLIRGEAGSRVNLLIRRNGRMLNVMVTREKINLPSVDYAWMDEGIALVTIYNFNLGTGEKFEQVVEELQTQGVKGIILDLRSNFGGYVEEALEVATLFVEGTLLKMREKEAEWKSIQSSRNRRLNAPVVILVNLGTASAAEMLAASLKDGAQSLLVGEVTFGKGTIQTLFPIQRGGYLKLTTAEFFGPGGEIIEEIGIEPHYMIYLPEDQMEKARVLVKQSIAPERSSYYYIKTGLEELWDNDDTSPLPVLVDNEMYFPLRATLGLMGRSIYSGDNFGEYVFYWENRPYQLNLTERLLTWNDPLGESFQEPFTLLNQTTYVPADFLSNGLGLPAFPTIGN